MSIDLSLSVAQEALREQVRELVARHAPRATPAGDPSDARNTGEAGNTCDDAWPTELEAALDAARLPALAVPADRGGGGGGLLEIALACEEIARAVPALAVAFADSALGGGWAPSRHGGSASHTALVNRLTRGELRVALALAECDAHVAATDDGHGVAHLDGEWVGVGASHRADVLLVQTTPGAPALAYVACRAPGVVLRPLGPAARRAGPLCELRLERVAVDAGAWLGAAERRAAIAAEVLEARRLLLAAASVGLAQAAFQDAVARAREPRAGGSPAGDAQAVQHALAALHTRIEAARLLVHHAAWSADAGCGIAPHGALARHYAADAANLATAVGMRVLGPIAARPDCAMHRRLDDAKPLELAGGGPEADRDAIARSLGL